MGQQSCRQNAAQARKIWWAEGLLLRCDLLKADGVRVRRWARESRLIEVYALNCLLLSRCDDDDDDDEISKRHLQWLPEPDPTSISTPQHQHWILRILMTDHASFPKFSNTFFWKKSRTSEVSAFSGNTSMRSMMVPSTTSWRLSWTRMVCCRDLRVTQGLEEP